ncbi:hypothetical protein MD484_g4738, partial [Candolleomyces efflorescens]
MQLLPRPYDEHQGRSREITQAVKANPWTRFLFYSPKTVSITLRDEPDAEKAMPTHWLNLLLGLVSRPPVLFPKLTELSIRSLQGVNLVIPFHIAAASNLRSLTVSDFSVTGRYDPSITEKVTSLVANFLFNSPKLSKLNLQSPLTESMLYPLSQYPSLESVSFVLPTFSLLRCMEPLNSMTGLKSVTLSAAGGPVDRHLYPKTGLHLKKISGPASRVKSNATSLKVTGGSLAIFKTVAVLVSPSLRSFIAKFSRGMGEHGGDDGAFITLLLLHRLSHVSQHIEHISFERDDPELELVEAYAAWLESEPARFTPQDLARDLPQLQNLTVLSFKFIAFVDKAFTVQLVAILPNLPKLQTLCLLPRPLTRHERHCLTLPTLECVRSLSSTNAALEHLTISIDLSTIPSDTPDLSHPGHALETLFIAPFYTPFKLCTSDLVSLSTYLDHLFPNLKDLTSFFEKSHHSNIPGLAEASALASSLWIDVDRMVRSYQSLRKHVYAQFADNHFAS